MLSTFFQGPAATYFESLTEELKATYDDLVASLKACFCLDVKYERYYREFEDAPLCPSVDPTLFLWRLKESLCKTEPTFSDSEFDALTQAIYESRTIQPCHEVARNRSHTISWAHDLLCSMTPCSHCLAF